MFFYIYFPRQIFPILKSFPNLMKNLPQPGGGGGGGLFQENIRAWIQVKRKFSIELFR